MDLIRVLTQPAWSVWAMPLSPGDLLGFVTGLWCVWLTTRASIWNFPVGILNSLILGVVFLDQRLFADASLQLVFITLGVLGWWQWSGGRQADERAPIRRSSWREQGVLLLVAALLTAVLTLVLHWVKGSVPLLDALLTALSLCAQWQLNRRQRETWLWWIAVDLISIPLYVARGLPLIGLLYGVFLLLCLKGWYGWRPQAPLAAGARA